MEAQSVRAEITIGNTVFKTPYVKSFNVTRQRGSFWASASASLEVSKDSGMDFVGGIITITVTVDGTSKLLFTGYVDKVDITPSQSRYSSTMISVAAYDILYGIHNLKINRRLQLGADRMWCAITSIVRKDTNDNVALQLKKEHMVAINSTYGGYYDLLSTTERPVTTTKSRDIGAVNRNNPDDGKYIPPHTHSSFDEGGPAIGVFGDYKLYTDR